MQNLIMPALILSASILLFAVIYMIAFRSGIRSRLQTQQDSSASGSITSARLQEYRGLSGWLFRAGFRGKRASLFFLLFTGLLMLTGLGFRYQLQVTGVIDLTVDTVRAIPGGVGNVAVPFVLGVPWFMTFVLSISPLLIVRSVRRRRVKEIEQDLPLLLDLLNTLAQAGIAFDAALEQVLEANSPRRPLTKEFRIFQVDVLAGRSRSDSLRMLMRRVDIPVFSSFISAILQAEMMGAGMSDTLKTQAKEIRERRKERARAAAMSIPTLLVLPMVIGFLPGIFIVLIGPLLFEAFGVLGQTLRGVSG